MCLCQDVPLHSLLKVFQGQSYGETITLPFPLYLPQGQSLSPCWSLTMKAKV